MGIYNLRPYRNRNNPGDGPPNDGWGPLGKTGCLIVAIALVIILMIAALIGATRSDTDPGATDPAKATPRAGGDARLGSRTLGDLASSLPASIGGTDLAIKEGTGVATNPRREGYYLDLAGDDRLGALLAPLERTLLDVRVAHAFAGDEGLNIMAFRVDGVAADGLVDGFVQMMRPIPSPYPAEILSWQTIDGRRVLVFGSERLGPGWAFFYPKGEVMFLAFDLPDGDIVEMADVLAGLP